MTRHKPAKTKDFLLRCSTHALPKKHKKAPLEEFGMEEMKAAWTKALWIGMAAACVASMCTLLIFGVSPLG
ncbi:hypothetical protein GCM10007860_26830 [Chitiniphilus shinanonensis]|uniref:Uncharacterized protein n=1 Tax=Chitiniphilus shinanonensis TaxID=553088 RepID=A0ABQ6C0L7_9NEIS|nr:hypothetical protein [Chitiniphilus shinanonensis]GLS05529.1 hypothetical protein GCM10007860_26830 [Chitiniphilus shinanonensis]